MLDSLLPMPKKNSICPAKSGAQRSREFYSRKLSAGTRRLGVWVCPANRALFAGIRTIDWSRPIKDRILKDQLITLSDSNEGLANIVAEPVEDPVKYENPASKGKRARIPNERPTLDAVPAGEQAELPLG